MTIIQRLWHDERGFIGTTAAILSAVAAASAAGAQVYGAHKATDSADRGAQLQVDAANHAADLKAKSDAAALAFQKSQAENAYQNSETTRRANYDQWAAREKRLASVGDALGYGARPIPDYVPGVDPHLDSAGSVGSLLGSSPTPTPGSPPPPSAAPPGSVLMRAPDGSTRAIPQAQVPYYLSKGVQRV